MKKILSFILTFVFLFAAIIPASAADAASPKEEVVYGILGLDGKVNSLYVVNIFNGGTITDYGSYSEIRNMTTSEELIRNGEQITIATTADKFYYQGTLDKKELPWDIGINYYLDDKEISGSELAGKSGSLKISMAVKENSKISSSFYNNYALQITFSLDNKLCSNIKAANATVAEAGSKKQLAYTVLPGNGIDINITADVHDFEMEPVAINGIKLALGINIDSGEFTNQITELSDAIKELDDGAEDLLNGLQRLSGGMQEYVNGMKAYKNGLTQLTSGIDGLSAGTAALSNGLTELAKQNAAIINGALAIQNATFDAVNAQLANLGLGLPVLTPENYSTVLASIPDLAAVRQQLDGAVQFTQGLTGYMEGVTQLGSGASELAKGALEFKSTTPVIAASANELYKAGEELNGALKSLRDGLALYKNGTRELRDGTSNIGPEIDNKIDEVLDQISGNGEKAVSFVSEKNTNISAVQFVLKTAAIETPEESKTVAPDPVRLSFWQKILKLFGLLK